MNRSPKPRPCPICRDEFTPKRTGLTIAKTCGRACALTHAELSGNQKSKPACAPKTKVKKSKTAAKLKKELWPIFSLHQKLVHSHDGQWCQCYTCEKPLQIGTINAQGGHCLSKAVYKNLYFDERAVRPQCYYCNINLGGMHYDFCEKLKLEIGADEFNEMKRTGRDVVKRDARWYQDNIAYYSAENIKLKALKS